MFKKIPNASNLLYTMLVAVLFVGCKEIPKEDGQQEYVNPHKKINSIILDGGDKIYTVEKDSCEYIVYDGYHSGNITHKKNCRFCLLRKNSY